MLQTWLNLMMLIDPNFDPENILVFHPTKEQLKKFVGWDDLVCVNVTYNSNRSYLEKMIYAIYEA